jgi:biotin carboxyl carrier protein
MKFTVKIDGRQETLEVVGGGTGAPGQVLRITRNGETAEVRVVHREGPHFVLEITEGEGDHVRRRRLRAAGYSDDAQRQLWVNGSNVHYEVQAQDGAATGTAAAHGASDGGLSASIPAVVSEILVAVDQEVRAGEKLILLESMKMILPVQAPHDGVVAAIHCEVGEAVQPGIPLIELQKGI